MSRQRKVEIFSAGCNACEAVIKLAREIACPFCDVSVLDMKNPAIADRATELGIQRVPAVVVDGKLADCCQGQVINESSLREAGVGQQLS